jgi:phospholipase C
MSIPIKHVVIIVKENHTFDNYFGTLADADGDTLPHAPKSTYRLSRSQTPNLDESSRGYAPQNPVQGERHSGVLCVRAQVYDLR